MCMLYNMLKIGLLLLNIYLDLSTNKSDMTTTIRTYLNELGIRPEVDVKFQLPVSESIEDAVKEKIGALSDTGALCFTTGEFTGRSPGSRFIVKDATTWKHVNWNPVNQPIDGALFDSLFDRVANYLSSSSSLYIRCARACHHPGFQQHILAITENPCQDIFVHNMFLRTDPQTVKEIDWSVVVASGLKLDDFQELGLPTSHCVCLDFTRKRILIIGTAYTGEIKKSVFSALNFHLPLFHDVLSMHCSANVGEKGDTALFFGLSGTGKTTLSSDKGRRLIGDDEHGWADNDVFNFEGGCYAKTIGLSEKQEPEIFRAIKFGALVENTSFYDGTRKIDFDDRTRTENTRVSYPTDFLTAVEPTGRGHSPQHIFFLSADAFGVLPPIAKLSSEQAMFYFINGYTAKVAGTEMGVKTPTATFSAGFGAAFLPLHPMHYATMLKQKLTQHTGIHVWLVNTGWIAGPYGVGRRIPLTYTRQLVRAALDGSLGDAGFHSVAPFDLSIPRECAGIPPAILDPQQMWDNTEAYRETSGKLKNMFDDNFARYAMDNLVTINQ